MNQRQRIQSFLLAIVATGLCIYSEGCSTEVKPANDDDQAADSYPSRPTGFGRGTSHLGAAVQSARDVAGRINQRQQDVYGEE